MFDTCEFHVHYTELLLLVYLNPAIIPDNKVSEFLSIQVPSSQCSVRRMYAIVIVWAKDSFFDTVLCRAVQDYDLY